MWLYFLAKILSHSEGTWLCDCILRNEIYPILRGPDYVIILSSLKIYPILRGPDYVIILSSQKTYPILRGPDYVIVSLGMNSNPFWGDMTMWLYFPAKNLSHSEGPDYVIILSMPKIYPILRGPDYVIILSSQNSIPFWGDLTMWLYFPKEWILSHSEEDLTMWLYPKEWNLSHSEGTWPDYTFLRPKNLSHSEGTWLCDYTF